MYLLWETKKISSTDIILKWQALLKAFLSLKIQMNGLIF
jgi:hypothetical protein